MKKIFIMIFAFLFCTTAKAQFETGDTFIGGGFYNTFSNFKSQNLNSSATTYGHNINVAWGTFVKDNKAVGWGINHTLSLQKLKEFNVDPRRLRNFGIGGERFWEFYKPLSSKFSVYVRPSLSLTYNLTNEYSLINDKLTDETRLNKVTVGASLGAGIVWRVTPKWALYGSFAFANPINISTGFGEIESYTRVSAGGENLKTKKTLFDYQFSPSFQTGSIGLGFRYFFARR
ncbi:outer membrane beta-barrel protein [Dyadobacter diqingensis]|uniref:outer membrane beta-barrel protein n=1 Tax=Dyadobacter diqingensis TaxID=2938121 RepID=UPI0020C2855B|nr:outer membrane beta-barrel protein [Dyadobacter diqingensis]